MLQTKVMFWFQADTLVEGYRGERSTGSGLCWIKEVQRNGRNCKQHSQEKLDSEKLQFFKNIFEMNW